MPARVALVHDFLLDLRGAERVFAALCDAWPDADVFTAVYDPKGTEGRFADRSPQTSFLQRLRPTSRTFRPLLPLYPHAIESLDLRGYDVVLSSSSAWAHGVIPEENAVHVCYCHNPFRYAWNERDATLAARSPMARAALGVVFQHRFRPAALRLKAAIDAGDLGTPLACSAAIRWWRDAAYFAQAGRGMMARDGGGVLLEGNRVLQLIRDVRDRGLPVILISHNMPHVFEVADRIHIQRLGRRATVITPQSHSMSDAVAIMTGAADPPPAVA